MYSIVVNLDSTGVFSFLGKMHLDTFLTHSNSNRNEGMTQGWRVGLPVDGLLALPDDKVSHGGLAHRESAECSLWLPGPGFRYT